MKKPVCHLPSHGPVCNDTWCVLRRGDRMSHFLKMPEDPRELLGPEPPGTAVHIGEGLIIPYGGGTQRGQRAREDRNTLSKGYRTCSILSPWIWD